MQAALELAQGPLFRLAIAVMVLGMARHFALSAAGYVKARRTAGRRPIDLGEIALRTARHMSPLRHLGRTRGVYTALTMILHAGILAVPLFLAGHIVLWRRAVGFGWPYLPMQAADVLTLITVATGLAIVVGRLVHPASRAISRAQDWLLPLLVALIFASGWLVAHPAHDFLPYPTTRLVHVLAGDLVILMVPFTKLAHMILLPFSQLVSEMGWRLVPGAGAEVRRTLGKEGQKV